MAFELPSFGLARTEWTAVDPAPDGRWLAVKVRPPRAGRGKPVVVRCMRSSGVAMGEHALGELQKEVGNKGWTLPLVRGDYQMLVLPEPAVLDSEMENSLRWNISSMIDFPVEQAVISWMRIPTIEFDAKRERQIYVIVARRELVDEHANLFARANITLRAVDVRETALRNIAALLEKKNEGIGLVTVDASGVTTTFTYRGELYLDRFISQPLSEVLEDATRQQRFLDRVAQQVYQSIDLLSRNFPFINLGRIVVGPVPGLDLARHLRGVLPVTVETLDLASIVDIAATPELKKPEMQSQYMVALGAALRGYQAS
jgi:MSHA biogenesis protein MshI